MITLSPPQCQTKFTFVAHGLDPEITQKLSSHFRRGDVNERWDNIWTTGTFLPWDNGCPNPALQGVLEGHRHVLGGSVLVADTRLGGQRRKRAFVPGCGRGYDVLLLASFGYDAYGLDVSKLAVARCNEASLSTQRRECGLREGMLSPGEFLHGRMAKISGWRRNVSGHIRLYDTHFSTPSGTCLP